MRDALVAWPAGSIDLLKPGVPWNGGPSFRPAPNCSLDWAPSRLARAACLFGTGCIDTRTRSHPAPQRGIAAAATFRRSPPQNGPQTNKLLSHTVALNHVLGAERQSTPLPLLPPRGDVS